jgi:hypothetical protein
MENDEEDVCSYCMILRKGYWKLKEEEPACTLNHREFVALQSEHDNIINSTNVKWLNCACCANVFFIN